MIIIIIPIGIILFPFSNVEAAEAMQNIEPRWLSLEGAGVAVGMWVKNVTLEVQWKSKGEESDDRFLVSVGCGVYRC